MPLRKLTNHQLQSLLPLSFLAAYAILLVRTAWMCDDAFITLRTIDNFVQGYGLVWNVGERVQVYTHPLWMFLLSAFYAFTREPYFTTLAISMALSLATVALLLWTSRRHLLTLLLVGIILVGSKAFADYSTSGLENPLAHLLLVTFFVLCLRRPPHPSDALPLGALAGLIMLNRLDHGVLVMPALLVAAVQLPRRAAVGLLTAAGAPVAGWLLFSLVYYGFPFPNTFYAKQTTGIPRIEYLEHGVGYLVDTAVLDGVTLLGIVFAVGLALWRRRPLTLLAAAAGIVLYVLYVIWIGGDFMGGRMFSAPLTASLTVLASVKPFGHKKLLAFLSVLPTLGLVMLSRPYLISPEPLRGALTDSMQETLSGKPVVFGTYATDERQFYRQLWLPPIIQGKAGPTQFNWARRGLLWREHKRDFDLNTTIGMFGYYAGQQVYVIDPIALSDAFLARVKLQTIPDKWFIGHVHRTIPTGYIVSKFTGQNQVVDPELRSLYDQIHNIISSQLFSFERLKYIVNLNILKPTYSINSQSYNSHEGVYYLSYPHGMSSDGKEFHLIVPTQGDGRRLFVRSIGSYQIEIKSKRGSVTVHKDKITNSRQNVFLLDLAEQVDYIYLSTLADNSADPAIFFILPSPIISVNPEIITSSFTTLNLRVPKIPNFAHSDPQVEPLWLTTTNRGLPMFAKVARKVPHTLEVKATPLCLPGKNQILRLWLNGQRLAEHIWTDCSQPWETQIFIPAEQLLEGWNLLEAEAAHGIVPAEVFPGNNDRRTLFVGFQRLWFQPAQ